MSELMTPISFRQLMTWITAEYDREGSVFGVHRPFHPSGKTLPIFGETIETPFGPAAGPNTQLAQNIVAGYFGGARFFELKTVQKMDGAELAACINADSVIRIIPGAIGDEASALTDCFQDNLLAPPVYTRPAEFNGWKVPDVLLSGNFARIDRWKEEQAWERTKRLRPDLLKEE